MLAPACHRIEVAGSIRRRAIEVGDIDLVCEPKTRPLLDLFGEPTGETIDELHSLLSRMAEDGVVRKRLDKNGRASWGKRLKRAIYRGTSVDVQSVTDSDAWGFWLLVRTGPSTLNKALVTPRHQGGLLPAGFEIRDGFKLFRAGGRVPTPTEEDVFRELGLPYLEPCDRDGAEVRLRAAVGLSGRASAEAPA